MAALGSFPVLLSTRHRLSSAACEAHSPTDRSAKVLATLLPQSTRMLLLLQIGLRFRRGLPSIVAVLIPIPRLRVVAVHIAIFSCVDIVRSYGDSRASACVVGKTAADRTSSARVHVARISCAGPSNYSCPRVITQSPAACNGIAGVNIGIGGAPGYTHGATLQVLESGSTGRAVIPYVGTRPGSVGICVSAIAPAAVYVRTGIASVAVPPGWNPAARPIVAPGPPPWIIVAISVA